MEAEKSINSLLDMRNVDITYKDKLVVNNFSLNVCSGEIVGIVGESGSGKSTVIKAAMGLLGGSGRIVSGKVLYRGIDMLSVDEMKRRSMRGAGMGMIFQNTGASLCPIRTIEQQLYECVEAHEKISRQAIHERALLLLEKLNLKSGERILKSYPFQLSGGMNQRVGIMLAMILKPQLLFADEPTSALDVIVQKQTVNEMLKLREMFGTAIVIVTHNIGVVKYMADRIIVMKQGKIVEYGKTATVIKQPQNIYTKKLLASVLRINKEHYPEGMCV